MSKWADYLIFKVCKENGKLVKEVAVKQEENDKISGTNQHFSKSKVINLIGDGNTFITIFENEDGTKWKKGEKVNVVSRNGKKYLRTDKNEIEEDNLGNLPEYDC